MSSPKELAPEEHHDNIDRNADSHLSTRSNLILYEEDGSKHSTLAAYLATGTWGHQTDTQPIRNNRTSNIMNDKMQEERNQMTMESFQLHQIIPSYQTNPLEINSDRSRRRSPPNISKAPDKKLGILKGVYIPSISNIYGVLLFVRLAWIVGNAGIGQALLICSLATLCTFLTVLSMSAIATNGKVAAGGAYYMISRSLGREFGGSVGLLFCLANSVGCSMYVLGVVEILVNYIAPQMSFKIPGSDLPDPLMNARVYGSCIVFVLAFIVLVGIGIVNKAAFLFSASVVIAIVAAFIGLLASNRRGLVEGVIGFPGDFTDNFPPAYDKTDTNGDVGNVDFFLLFGIFFPSVTGIMAGASRSGDLRDPGISIPYGTLAAQVTTSITYYAFILLFGTVISGELLREKIPESGLLIASVSWPSHWVTLIGCLFSSLGAGLQCFVSAPRLFQALAKDNVIPFLHPFSNLSTPTVWKGFELLPGGEPRMALLLTFIITECVVLIGNLDPVANIVTMLYLVTYLFINASTALLGFIKSPNWRPSWKYYHWVLSAFASIICITYMFMISWYTSLAALGLMIAMYKYIEYRGAMVQWGDGLQALHLQIARNNLYDASKHVRHRETNKASKLSDTKNWRPQIIGFVETCRSSDGEFTVKHPSTLDFLSQLRKGGGLTVVSSIVLGDLHKLSEEDSIKKAEDAIAESCEKRHLECFTSSMISPSLKYGILSMTQCYGVGVLKPNTVVLGYPRSWSARHNMRDGERYVDILCSIIALDKAVIILKGSDSFPNVKEKQKGTIDVYWIMHDGGILTLLSHILRKHSVWRECKLRIFAIAQLNDNSVAMKENLVQSLKFLRIDAEAIVLELGDYDISDFAYERTMKIKERQALLKNIQGDNLLAQANAASNKSLVPDDDAYVEGSLERPISRKYSTVSIINRFKEPSQTPTSSVPSTSTLNTKGEQERVDSEKINAKAPSQNGLSTEGEDICTVLMDTSLQPEETDASNADVVKSKDSGKRVGFDSPASGPILTSLNEKRVTMMNTSVKLNKLMKDNSCNELCKLVFCNLPAPGKKTWKGGDLVSRENAVAYLEYLEALTDGLEKIVLIKGTGTEVVTTYF